MKKKRRSTTSCGASSRYASARFSKADCFSPRSDARGLTRDHIPVRSGGRRPTRSPPSRCISIFAGIHLLELTENFVAAGDGIVHRFLDRLLPEKAGLDLFLDGDVGLCAVAEAEAAGIVARGAARQLQDGDLTGGVVFVIALRLGRVVGGLCHRHVAG